MSAPSAAPVDRVVVPHPGSGFDLFIYTMYEKAGWQARKPGTQTRAPHPGSAVDYEGQLYEVIEIGPGEGTRHTYRYALRKWEERFVVRRAFPYTAQTRRAEVRQIRERQKRHRRHSLIIYTFPVSTLLPSPLLQRWQHEWGLPMYALSLVSAFLFGPPLAGIGISLLFFSDAPRAGLICVFIGAEEMVRLGWMLIFSGGEPQGSPLITALWRLVRPHAETTRSRSDYVSPAFADEVRYLKEQPWDAEVHTVFRDPMLLGEQPVDVEGKVYQPVGYIQQGEGLYRRYVFRLKEQPEGTAARREYKRERTPQVLKSLIAYERRRDWIHNWALLYGFLPAKEQLKLESKYDFLSVKATSLTAALMLALAGVKLLLLIGGKFDYSHLVTGYIALESVYRLALAQTRGEPAGSLFGWLLLPFLPR